jgi:hypothetical protein
LLIPLRDQGHFKRMGPMNGFVLQGIYSRCGPDWMCRISNERLASDLGISPRAVQLATSRLEKSGYIWKSRADRWSTNIYHVVIPREFPAKTPESNGVLAAQGAHGGAPRGARPFRGGAHGGAHKESIKKGSLKSTLKSSSSRRGGGHRPAMGPMPESPTPALTPDAAAIYQKLLDLEIWENVALPVAMNFPPKVVIAAIKKWREKAKSKQTPAVLSMILKQDLKQIEQQEAEEERQIMLMAKKKHLLKEVVAEWAEMEPEDKQRLIHHVARNQDSDILRDSVLHNHTSSKHEHGLHPAILKILIERMTETKGAS